jgi:hypothetical protein
MKILIYYRKKSRNQNFNLLQNKPEQEVRQLGNEESFLVSNV